MSNFKIKTNFFTLSFFLRSLLFFFSLTFIYSNSYAQKEKPARILFLVDGSSSMLHEWKNGETRFEAGARIITSLIDSIYAVNSDVAFAVRVFGTQYPAQDKNCFDSKFEVSFSYQNNAQIKARLAHIRPIGYSPIAWSLKEAAEKDFVNNNDYSYSIILVTDGGESCGGDICATVENLISKKISFTPYILSLVDYAPLKLEYECLGKYLQITKESEIAPAIQTIVADNKKVLTVKALTRRVAPVVPKAVSQKPEPKIVKNEAPKPEPKAVREIPVPVVKEEPIVKVEEKVPEKPVVIPVKEIARAKVPVLSITSITKPRRFNLLYALEEAKTIRVPTMSRIDVLVEEDKPVVSVVTISKPEPPKPVSRARTSIVPTIEKPPVVAPITTKTEDAEKTQVQIYFTNGKGKFYNTEVNLKLYNKQSKVSKSVFRTMAGSQPSPMEIEEGTYDITIPGSKVTALNVPIIANKMNKIYIEAGRASIGFMHPTAPDKPVEEYTALISQRFVKGSQVIKQLCSEELPYDPQNYHIEINTLPPLVYNVTLNLDEKKLLAIPEPGTVQITNTEKLGKIQFWYLLGDRYEPFLNMDIQGKPENQNARLLPGKYQVRYYKLPVMPNQKAELIPFSILKNQTTSIYLAP